MRARRGREKGKKTSKNHVEDAGTSRETVAEQFTTRGDVVPTTETSSRAFPGSRDASPGRGGRPRARDASPRRSRPTRKKSCDSLSSELAGNERNPFTEFHTRSPSAGLRSIGSALSGGESNSCNLLELQGTRSPSSTFAGDEKNSVKEFCVCQK